MSRVTLDDIADDMYKTFKRHNALYGGRGCNESVAFWHTIREHFKELRQETLVSPDIPRSSYVDYREHLNKKTGLIIGEKINEEKEVRHKWIEKGFMGERVNTQVWVLKLPQKTLEELDRERRIGMKFRKKPVVIEAFIFGFHKEPQWFIDAVTRGQIEYEWRKSDHKKHPCDGLKIKTLEGDMRSDYGHEYIIKGVRGEIYPCHPEIFEETYEQVEVIEKGE